MTVCYQLIIQIASTTKKLISSPAVHVLVITFNFTRMNVYTRIYRIPSCSRLIQSHFGLFWPVKKVPTTSKNNIRNMFLCVFFRFINKFKNVFLIKKNFFFKNNCYLSPYRRKALTYKVSIHVRHCIFVSVNDNFIYKGLCLDSIYQALTNYGFLESTEILYWEYNFFIENILPKRASQSVNLI